MRYNDSYCEGKGRKSCAFSFIYIIYNVYTGEPLVGRARRASFYMPPRNCGGRVIFRFVHIIRKRMIYRSVDDEALLVALRLIQHGIFAILRTRWMRLKINCEAILTLDACRTHSLQKFNTRDYLLQKCNTSD